MRLPGLQLKVDGQWLAAYGAWGGLAYSHAWPGGCKDASWKMTATFGSRLPILRRGASVQVLWGGWCVWSGYLSEPEWNGDQVSLTANGLFRRGEQWKAFVDAAGSATTDNPTTAITNATGIGWTVGAGIPNSNLATGTSDPVNTISALLDAHAEVLGQRWQVDAFSVATMSADPTTPSYLIRAGAGDLGIAEDNYASHVVVRHLTNTGTYRSAIYPTPLRGGTVGAYEARYGHREVTFDVVDKGPMADAAADSLAQQVYTRSLQRPGWTNGLLLGHGEILTPGWKPVNTAAVKANAVARLLGVPDEVALTSYTDFVIGETQFEENQADQVTVNPVGLVSRSPEDVLTELLEGMYPEVAA